jgi:hypothetical protein
MKRQPNDDAAVSKWTQPHLVAKTCPERMKFVLLALAAIHMLGVLAEPLRFFSRSPAGDAPEFGMLANIARPYSQWMYLDHGYFFFAPNPGPGRLVQYSAVAESDDSQSYVFPDRKRHWPRLLYHRYFMLSEFYHSRFAPNQVTEELRKDPEFLAGWNLDSHLYQQLQQSITNHLAYRLGATRVELRRLQRALPEPGMIFQDRLKLNDPRFVETLPESMVEPLPLPTPSTDKVPTHGDQIKRNIEAISR